MSLHNDEFYVGYLGAPGPATRRDLRRVLFLLCAIMAVTGLLLATAQRHFSSAEFEYKTPTQLKGYLFTTPVPHLRIVLDEERKTPVYQAVLLVGSGKAGAEKLLASPLKKQHFNQGTLCIVTGNLIYGNARSVLQISEEQDIQIIASSTIPPMNERPELTQRISITGEIVDPKCYFGVMKPGEGKTHRSCAIRCISGGIPPVLHTLTGDYVLVGENNEPLNSDVLQMVGDGITINGLAYDMGGWKVLHVSKRELREMNATLKANRSLEAFTQAMTVCRPDK